MTAEDTSTREPCCQTLLTTLGVCSPATCKCGRRWRVQDSRWELVGAPPEPLDERRERVMRDLETDLVDFADNHVLGHRSTLQMLRSTEEVYEGLMERQGMEDVCAKAARVWQCTLPLEPEPPTFYPGLEVEIRRNRGIAGVSENGVYPRPMGNSRGRVDFADGDRVLVRADDRADLEACLPSQLIPLGPPLERRFCSHKVGYTFWTRLKLRVFGNAGRCPLHGVRLQEHIDVRIEGRLPRQDMVEVTMVVE